MIAWATARVAETMRGGGQGVGEDVESGNPYPRGTNRPCGQHVIKLPHRQHLPAHEPGGASQARDSYGDHDVGEAGAKERCYGQGKDQGGNNEEGVHEPHDDLIKDAAAESRQQAQGDADTVADGHGQQADLH